MSAAITRTIALISLALVIAGCSGSDSTDNAEPANAVDKVATVTGTVTYRERMALSPGALVTVSLQDVSRQDVAAEILAETEIENPGQVPIEFSLDYDPAAIDERFTYVVRAAIRDRGQLMYTTDRAYPVLTRDAGDRVDLVLVRVTARAADAGWGGIRWEIEQLLGDPVVMPEGRQPPTLQLDVEAQTLAGFAGCNRFTGSYRATWQGVSIGPLAVTSMACVDGMELEQRYLQALDRIDRFAHDGDRLRAYAGQELLVEFVNGGSAD